MCGIAGYISKEKPSERVFKMWQHLEKRGPDAFGSWSSDCANLYHTRLSILDLSANGNQPMETDRWVLVYNGEIYNYQDLKSKISPRAWKSYNDTETILFYIDEFGLDRALNDADGMFAIAAYDKFEHKLHLAADPFGIKPIFYTTGSDYFAFASSPGALTHIKDKWKLNKGCLIDMLALGATRDPLFYGINKVYGGGKITYDHNSKSLSSSNWYKRKEYVCNESDLIDAVKYSIEISRRSDVPSFIFLSGGIDSTIIASQCKHMNAVHLASPEEVYAKQAAEKYSNTLFFIDPNNFSAKGCLEDYSFQSGDCSMSAIIPYIVSKEVSKFGKVAISANGADELFFGYNRMLDNVSITQFNHIFRNGLDHTWGKYSDFVTTRDLELKTYVQFDLNKTLDFASMCHSLEVRVPYLNRCVVELAMSIPRGYHVNGYGNKSILKKFLKSEGFSNEFLNRQKIGFSLHSEPNDYAHLKVEGLRLLRNEFDIKTHFHNARDARYFEASAAAFYCWWNVWKNIIYEIH